MSYQFTAGRFKGWASDNTPLAGGRLYTYSSGTTTHKAAYTDATLGAACTYVSDGVGGLYIALDSKGEAQLWLGSGAYTFKLTDSSGSTVWTVDGVRDQQDATKEDLASTSDASKGAGMSGQSALLSYATGTVGEKLNRAKSVQDYPWLVVGNGVADDSTKLSSALAAGVTDLFIDCPVYLNGSVTAPSTVGLHFGDRGYLIIGASASVTINGPVYSNHNPFKYASGVGSLTVSAQNLSVPGSYPTIQRAVDAVPGMIWQDWNINLAAGTYAEDVRIESKSGGVFKPGSSGTAAARAQLSITGASLTSRDPAVMVKSFIAIDCHGGAYHPAIANLTVTGKNAYTNENEAIAFYGCSGGAVSKVSFAGTGANKCVMSFGSRVTVEGLHFGTSVNNIGLVTKHGGQIVAPDAFALNGQLDLEGTLIDSVSYPISGFIDVANISKAISTGYYEYDDTGLRSGIGVQSLNRSMTGPKWFHEFLSSWQTYFSSTSEFESSVDAGATFAFVASEGLNLQTVNAKQATFYLRRSRSIQTTQRQLTPSQLVVSMYVNTVTGDGIVRFGNKGSVSEAGYGFKITTTGLYGYYQNGAGAEVLTSLLVPYATLSGKTWTLFANAQYGGSVIFKALNDSAGGFKQQLAEGTVSGSSTYQWFAQASSAATGTADVTFSEARIARY